MPTKKHGIGQLGVSLLLVIGCLFTAGGCTSAESPAFQEPTWRLGLPKEGRVIERTVGDAATFVVELPRVEDLTTRPLFCRLSFDVKTDKPVRQGRQIVYGSYGPSLEVTWDGRQLAVRRVPEMANKGDAMYVQADWDYGYGEDRTSLLARCKLKYSPPELALPVEKTITFSLKARTPSK